MHLRTQAVLRSYGWLNRSDELKRVVEDETEIFGT